GCFPRPAARKPLSSSRGDRPGHGAAVRPGDRGDRLRDGAVGQPGYPLDRDQHHVDRGAEHRRGDPARCGPRGDPAGDRPVTALPAGGPALEALAEPVVELTGIETRLGGRQIHAGVDFTIRRGELVALIGGSGSGKSVLLRETIGLLRPNAGTVRLLGTDVWAAPPAELDAVRRRFGMMFQEGALFSSLSVAENVATPLREHTDTPADQIDALVDLRLSLAGFPIDSRGKLPSELSGGMKKRAAIARALSLEPEILFLDEPTSGLDPITARAFDDLM